MNIGQIFTDLGFEAVSQNLKKGKGIPEGTGKIGKILSGLGSFGLGTAGVVGNTALGVTGGIGKSIVNQFGKNSGHLIGAALAGAALGGIVADQDGQVDPGKAALKGGAIGLGLSAIPGGAAAMTGLGIGVAGMGVMAANAFGEIGKHMVKPKTIGEKAEEFTKDFKAKNPKLVGEAYEKKLGSELEKAGLEVGSKKAVKIGIGNLSDFKLSKMAVPLIVGSSLIEGLAGGVKAFEKSRMGVNDGMMRSATPMLPRSDQTAVAQPGNPTTLSNSYYANNAGATGDLVFAMHKNR
jgi:hypothetical protein